MNNEDSMTAPTPEQMRALADAPDINHWSAAARDALRAAADQLEAAVPDHLNAAADEVHRLRAAESLAYADRAQALMSLGRQLETNAQLRAVIENAPHDDKCVHARFIAAGWTPQGRCTCWKADVP